MAMKYINLRFHFGGILVSDLGHVYIGGNKEYAFNIDTDYLPISKVKDYCKEFGVFNMLLFFMVEVGEGLNAPLGKEIELIDGRSQIQGVQTSNLIGKSTENTDELKDEFRLSNEDFNEDDVEPTVHDQVEEDENIDLSGDEDVGIDPDFEDIDRAKKNLSGKLLLDEPFYDSSEKDSFGSESEGESDVLTDQKF
ncbi:hypothetical protein HAX54_012906 [Datura stramonium]|uniref:PB1-like domain-containing protein n=1 Tax=Datura stramonium TaxID=4076 RepID=A0ABS8S1A3_DATST|nr:hypothetical protein [Datura stramonium]